MNMPITGGRYCVAVNCPSSWRKFKNEPENKLSLFRFPTKDAERCKIWVQNCRREDLRKRPMEMLMSKVLCSAHFEESQFMNKQKNKLVWNAIPTLFDVPNPPKPISIRRKPPKVRETIGQMTKARKKTASTTQLTVESDTSAPETAGKNESASAEHVKESTSMNAECGDPETFDGSDRITLEIEEVLEGDLGRLRGSFQAMETSPDDVMSTEASSNDINITAVGGGVDSKEYYIVIYSDGNIEDCIVVENLAPCSQADLTCDSIVGCPTARLANNSESTTKCAVPADRKSTRKNLNRLTIATYPPALKGLYRKLRTIQNKAARLKKQLKCAKENARNPNLSIDDVTSACREHNVNETAIEIIRAQLRMSVKKRVQWSNALQELSVALYRESPSAYSKWAELLQLPSKTSVHRWTTKLKGAC